ncbi:MAG: DUF1800 family protein [Hyphomicrobiales bacterium]|nr:DUF1800 family protein [Hyphomicrobiales bacterium]MBV8769671.1 DUF1800 family protein [Hyphomicrobiales bacterium]MBV9052875.1 DUF1800 family protein [Hyphomicrobiales bacterium]MBV9588461.1 DUF1800 family protein [Hyphomicrobiales bacterium]MBV9975461.1 DUF1800 family protein [Hyphomicrobiales bacterium]
MVQSPDRIEAALALSRFGLGARQGDLEAISSDPRGALKEEIANRTVPSPAGEELKPTAELLNDLYAFQEAQKEMRERKAAEGISTPAGGVPQPPSSGEQPGKADAMKAEALSSSSSMAGEKAGSAAGTGAPGTPMKGANEPKPVVPFPQRVFLAEAKARFSGTIHAPRIGFGERLAMFWANHFAISAAKGPNVRVIAGAFERETIRPHVFGRFADMLLAVETHPAMLFYLDNQQSFGPNSPAGQNRKRGLNENLAREILELHTLGVNGGYTQDDVTSLARIITGWTVVGRQGRLGTPGSFVFFANAHEPGDQQLLGNIYAEAGFEQGKAALLHLARHPATAAHLAQKLARHFVSDDPPSALVDKLAKTFMATDGDLAAVSTALVEAKESWTPQLAKVRSPLEFSIAILRATGAKPEPQPVLGGLYVMGQPYWQPSGPNGFSDLVDAWASPEGLKMRMDIANVAATKGADYFDPPDFIETRLGPLLSKETRSAVGRAESRAQGLAIAFMSPEFQRR